MKGYHYIKRGIDIILSGMAIVILSPLLLFLCIAIKLDTPGPILFKVEATAVKFVVRLKLSTLIKRVETSRMKK